MIIGESKDQHWPCITGQHTIKNCQMMSCLSTHTQAHTHTHTHARTHMREHTHTVSKLSAFLSRIPRLLSTSLTWITSNSSWWWSWGRQILLHFHIIFSHLYPHIRQLIPKLPCIPRSYNLNSKVTLPICT